MKTYEDLYFENASLKAHVAGLENQVKELENYIKKVKNE